MHELLHSVVGAARSVAIVSHVRPDGDTIGGALALYSLCRAWGKEAVLLCEGAIPNTFDFVDNNHKYRTWEQFVDTACITNKDGRGLCSHDIFRTYKKSREGEDKANSSVVDGKYSQQARSVKSGGKVNIFEPNDRHCQQIRSDKIASSCVEEYDLVFAIDCADVYRLGKFRSLFEQARYSVNIDHHYTNDNYADLNIVDRQASSTCQVLFEYFVDNKIAISQQMASCLYVGLSTDTGHFMHSNVNGRVFAMASKIADTGVDIENIVRKLYKQSSKLRLRLLAQCLSSIRYFEQDRIAIMTLTGELLDSTSESDTEGFVRYCVDQATVQAGAMIAYHTEGRYKVSLRSVPGVDVSLAAQAFGGGGHKLAAGCMIRGDLEEVVDKVAKALSDCLMD